MFKSIGLSADLNMKHKKSEWLTKKYSVNSVSVTCRRVYGCWYILFFFIELRKKNKALIVDKKKKKEIKKRGEEKKKEDNKQGDDLFEAVMRVWLNQNITKKGHQCNRRFIRYQSIKKKENKGFIK